MSRRLALVVGNATFPGATDLTDLRTPLNDANAVAVTLGEFSDFDVTEVLLDDNANVLKERIEAFLAEARRGDAALLYYSGHGFKDRSGELYLAAHGTNTERPLSTAVEANFLRRAMQQSHCKHIVVVLDSCYSGAFNPSGKGTETPEFLEALGGETIAVLASSRGGQLSFEGEGDLSRFTQAMLEGIRTGRADANADGEITLQEVFDYTRDQLGPSQTPSFRLGKAGGDIFIARGIQERPAAVYLAAVEEDAYLRTWLAAKLSLTGYQVQHLSFAEEPAAATWLERLSRTAGAFVPLFSGEAIRDDDFTAQLRVASEANKYRSMLVPVDAGGWYEETFTFDPGRSADFTRNWADGLKQVEGLLSNLGVPKGNGPDATQLLDTWKQDLGVRDSLLATKRESYRSNWFRVLLPEHLYVHAYNPGEQPRMDDFPYSAVMEPGYLISFASGEHFKEHLGIWESYRIRVTDFLGGRDFLLEDGSRVHQAGHRLIDLLNRVVSRHLLNKGLLRYEQSSDDVYYFDLDGDAERPHRKVSLKPVGHNWVQLTGVMRALTWHYGVSVKPFLYPYPAIFLGAHIIFKDKGRLINTKQQHRSRRRKGKGLYNKQWRDLLLGTMLYLADGEQRISIPTGSAVPIEDEYRNHEFTPEMKAHMAWTQSTTAYYKLGRLPWKLTDIRDGVCYLGLVFKRVDALKRRGYACSAAQMFLDSGDGTVFKGNVGPWESVTENEFHLDKNSAKELVRLALESYRDKRAGNYPREVFIHGRAGFADEEWEGFKEAVGELSPDTKLTGIVIRESSKLKLLRDVPEEECWYGNLRGLAYVLGDSEGYLWTRGFVPRLDTSTSLEIPNPLRVRIDRSTDDAVSAEQVLRDVLALSKLNYNACVFGDGLPVTLRFSDMIGNILTAIDKMDSKVLPFKY